MTVVAYQGLGSLDGPHQLARSNGKGLFVLAATSNPEAATVQTARLSDGQSVAASIVAGVKAWNVAENEVGLGSTGVVLGATVVLADYSIALADLEATPVLAPGFGFQGAAVGDLRATYGAAADNVIVAASRSILSAGPRGIADAIGSEAAQVAAALQP
jgi:orotidine-5'-phosphate decarboxylase